MDSKHNKNIWLYGNRNSSNKKKKTNVPSIQSVHQPQKYKQASE